MRRGTHDRRLRVGLVGVLGSVLWGGASGALAQEAGVACSDWGSAVVVDPWQRTLVGGTAADNRILEWDEGHAHYGDFAVARLRRDGSFDPSFGEGGSVILDQGDFDSVAAMALSRGHIIVAGTTQQREGERSGPRQAVVFKLDSGGERVESFAADGLAGIGLDGSQIVESVAAGRFGQVYVAGTLEHAEGAEGFVVRLDRRGEPSSAFGANGVLRLGKLAGIERVHGMALVDGALMVAGQRSRGEITEATVARLDLSGRLLWRYGYRGVASLPVPGALAGPGSAFFSRLGSAAVSLQVAADGGTQIATVVFSPRGRARLGPELDAPTGTQDSTSAGAFWGDTLYLAGATYPDDFLTGDAFLARRRAGDSGYSVTSARFDLEYAAYGDLAVSWRSATVVGWNFGEADDTLPPSDALVVRYRHDGSLDAGFGDGGVALVDFMRGQAVCGPRVVEE